MNTIGIIANPISGSDIRRIVSMATAFDNNEKMNIVKRIILGADALGIDRIFIMPDLFRMGIKAIDGVKRIKKINARCEVLDMEVTGTILDTIEFSKRMEEMAAGCVVVLGGDGTSRAAAKYLKNTPMLPVSTGTNNVYPYFIEGTVAGVAACIISKIRSYKEVCIKDKIIEIYMNGEFRDIALIDAVVSADKHVGSKAIWDFDKISKIIVTRAHPKWIGFSSIAGSIKIIKPEDDFGAVVDLGADGTKIIAPVAAGIMKIISIDKHAELLVGEECEYSATERSMIALDGEREIMLNPGDKATFKINRNGPLRVEISKTLEMGQSMGLFRLNQKI